MNRATGVGEHARMAQLYPSGSPAQGLLAVDLLEVEPGGSTAMLEHAEEHLLFVISGTGEIRGGGTTALLRANSAVHVGPREAHQLRNTGSEKLRVLISTPLLVRSDRALGYETKDETTQAHRSAAATEEPAPAEARRTDERAQPSRVAESVPPMEPVARQSAPAPADEEEAPVPDISSLMKRGSDIAAGTRPERRRPVPEPELEPAVEDSAEEEEEQEEHRDLMELLVVFDGGSRGNPGQGYGSYLVQSPGRKPVIKQVEFGGNYTNNQAEYDSLIACLQYIIERLMATNRKPEQVALDIKSDSDLLVNQLQGTYKVKDAGLRQRHAKAEELLAQFGEWMITWHPREESVRLLGH
jgi:ribonuclease HI/quercetin dioxygenase-like cupin family protein